MDEHKQGTAEIHNNGWFKELFIEFLDHLAKTCEQNRSNPRNLQKEVEKLIKKGKDMVQSVQDEVRFAFRRNNLRFGGTKFDLFVS